MPKAGALKGDLKMAKLSKNLKDDEAINAIAKMTTVNGIERFTQGDTRSEVIAARNARLSELKPAKDGATDKMTKTKDSPAGGVEGNKSYVTGDDVVKAMRGRGVKI